MQAFVHALRSRMFLTKAIANERGLVVLNKQVCGQHWSKTATAHRVESKVTNISVLNGSLRLLNSTIDALLLVTLALNAKYVQRPACSNMLRLKPNEVFYQILLVFTLLSAFLFRIDAAHANASKTAQLEMGQVLFAFYQGDHYGALLQQQMFDNTLLNEEQQQQMALLKGGLSLSYGLTQQAQEVFEELLEEQSGRSTQAMAWFWLGKIHYQQHDYVGAQTAFAQLNKKVRKKLDKGQEQEMRYMQAQIAMHIEPGKVEKHLDDLDKQSIYRAYINFNRGVELLDGGEREQGIAWLQQAYQTPDKAINRGWLSRWFAPSEEQLLAEHQALNDRIQLALGYGFMQANEPELAVNAFTKIHDQSLDTHAALLGYGWALAQQKDYEKALAVWHQLIQQPDSGLFGYEAMLASAYAFEQVDANNQALTMLNEAESHYEERLIAIEAIQSNVAEEDYFQPFIQGLATRYQRPEEGRFSVSNSVEVLPEWIGQRHGYSALVTTRYQCLDSAAD